MHPKLIQVTKENAIKKIGVFCKENALLEKGDKILIGVSGGKDSFFLLDSLASINKKLKDKVALLACHIHLAEAGYKTDINLLAQYCEKLSVPFIQETVSVDFNKDEKKAPCFVCSWHRRKRLFEIAKDNGCNKLALGHHADDAIETLFMNMIYHGSISSMPAKLKMFGGRMYLIRPMLELSNDEIDQIAGQQNYPLQIKECIYGNNTQRSEMRNLLRGLYNVHKNARKNIFRSMSNIFEEYLPGL